MRVGILFFLLLTPQVQAQEIKSVNFVQEGEVSKLIIETDKDVLAERVHVTEDKQIILDLKNVKVSPKLLRGIDTSEFPGSAVFISGYKKPGSKSDVRFAIQLRDNVRSILDNKGTSIVLNIENRFGVFSQSKVRTTQNDTLSSSTIEDTIGFNVPKSNSIEDILQNLTLSGPKKYVGKRISINVREIPVTDVLNMIADTSGFNIIVDQEVSKLPPLTLSLTNIPWDQALDTIMNISKMVADKNANILIMKTSGQAAKEREEQNKSLALKQVAEPLVTRVFLINYATLGDIEKILKDYLTPVRASIQTDNRTNSLIVRDTVESIERIKKIIETLDTQTPQILIEAKIVEVNESYRKNFGLTGDGLSFGYDPFKSIEGQANVGPGFSFSSSSGLAGMTVGIFKRLTNLTLNLQLMESESKGRIITSPKVVTQNKMAANISSTDETSFPTPVLATANQPARVAFESASAAVTLAVTPQVTNDGAISLVINLSKSSFGTRPNPEGPPNKTSRSLTTNVLVDNGSTVMLGGLYQTAHLEGHQGIPFLKDLPLIGWLFRTAYNPTDDKNELIIFITPRIMNQEAAGLIERQASNSSATKPEI